MRNWERPMAVVDAFVANEFVSACGDSGTVYKFKCNAGIRSKDYNVYLKDGTPYATSGRDYGGCKTDYDSYHPCGTTHSADSDSGFLAGYMYEQDWWGHDSGRRIDVIIWTDNYTNVHCTTDLDQSSWETQKS